MTRWPWILAFTGGIAVLVACVALVHVVLRDGDSLPAPDPDPTALPITGPAGRSGPHPESPEIAGSAPSRRQQPVRAAPRPATGPVKRTPGEFQPAPARVEPCLLGLVRNMEGRSVAGAIATLVPRRPRRVDKDEPPEAPPAAVTDDHGHFRIELRVGDAHGSTRAWPLHRVSIRAAGYLTTVMSFRPGQEQEVILGRPGSLGGRVFLEGPEEEPCPDTRIVLDGPRRKKYATGQNARTDSQGVFRISALMPGSYSLDTFPPGAPPLPRCTVHVREGEHTEVRLEIERGVTVSGQVTARGSGQPLSGVTVTSWATCDKPVLSDAQGRYRLQGLPSRITIKFIKDGYLAADAILEAPSGAKEKNVDVALSRPGTIHGTVLGPDGRPAPSAHVALVNEKHIYTNQAGAFTIPNVWPGENQRVRAWLHGTGEGLSLPFAVRDGKTVSGLVVSLRPALPKPAKNPVPVQEPTIPLARTRTPGASFLGDGVVTGCVRDDTGVPVAGARVELFRASSSQDGGRRSDFPWVYSPRPFRETHTNPDGTFRIDRLPAGAYRLGARADTFTPHMSGRFTLTGSPVPRNEDVSLEPAFSLICAFQDASGRPLRRAAITAQQVHYPQASRVQVLTDDQGKALLGPVGAVPYRVFVRQAGRYFASRQFTFERDTIPVLSFSLGRTTTGRPEDTVKVEGKVVHASTGAPISWFWVRLQSDRGSFRQQFADVTGRFCWVQVKPGRYTVEAGTDDGCVSTDRIEVHVDPDQPAPPLTIPVHPGGKVAGQVLDPTGRPAARAQVALHRGEPGAPVAKETAGVDGRFSFAGLAPGAYEVRAFLDPWVEATSSVTVQTGQIATVEIPLLEAGGTLSILAVEQGGGVVSSVSVTIRRPDRSVFTPTLAQIKRRFRTVKLARPELPWSEFFLSVFQTNESGELTCPYVPPGRYTVRGSETRTGREAKPVEVVVADRALARVTLVLPAEPPAPPEPANPPDPAHRE